jgi:hypothetical protein
MKKLGVTENNLVYRLEAKQFNLGIPNEITVIRGINGSEVTTYTILFRQL